MKNQVAVGLGFANLAPDRRFLRYRFPRTAARAGLDAALRQD